jgi:hypothetical protein
MSEREPQPKGAQQCCFIEQVDAVETSTDHFTPNGGFPLTKSDS